MRDILDPFVHELVSIVSRIDALHPESRPGDLNYIITTLIIGILGNEPHYKDYNEIIGVLECVKSELYRRQVSGYEDKKAIENGDVYKEGD